MKRKLIAVGLVACVLALVAALAGCGQQEASSSSSEPGSSSKATYTKDPFYVLVVGDDSRVGTVDEGRGGHAQPPFRSDTIMLVRVDPTEHLFTVVSVPRDVGIELDGETVKLNKTYSKYGNEGLVERIEEMTGVKIDYYLDTTFVGFEELVDKMGGVEVNVPVEMSLQDIVNGDDITLQAGTQTLNGPEALVLARVRKIFVDMDSTRQYNDRALLIALMQKAIDNPAQAATYAQDLFDCLYDTNLPADALAYYLNDFIANAKDVKFYSGSFPAEGGLNEEVNLWLADYDPAMWKSIMEVVDRGGDPTTVYEPPFG